MVKAVIFDFDGVIHDTFELHRAWIKKFTGKDIPPEEYRKIHDGNFYSAENALVVGTDWLGYRKFIKDDFVNMTLAQEIRQAVLDLAKMYSLFIISSGSSELISRFLERNNSRKLFQGVLGAESHRSKEQLFRQVLRAGGFCAEDCIFITDTLGDVIEANRFGIRCIAVDFGFHDRKRLEQGNPLAIVSRFPEIADEIVKVQVDKF